MTRFTSVAFLLGFALCFSAPLIAADLVEILVIKEQTALKDEAGKGSGEVPAGKFVVVLESEPDRLLVTDGHLRGWVAAQKTMPLDEAVSHFTKVVGNEPDNAAAHAALAGLLLHQGHADRAYSLASEAMKLDPKMVNLYIVRGNANKQRGQYREALADFNKAVELAPKSASAHNSRAWFLANSADAEYRDAEEAIKSAKQAVELEASDHYHYMSMDTLASAYAEAGQFEQAVEWQSKAIESAPQLLHPILQKRLDLYRSGKTNERQPEEGQN